jgi:hypothetical protein
MVILYESAVVQLPTTTTFHVSQSPCPHLLHNSLDNGNQSLATTTKKTTSSLSFALIIMSASPAGTDPPPPPPAVSTTPESRWDHSPLDLKGLLASLASFAKAAQGLPVGEEFSFESSFPDFQKALKSAQAS